MAATKEQERKALEKIKKIVTDLGEDSYISMAFEGCFEIAEGNIENDFGCSMKQRAESSAAEAAKYKEMYESAVKVALFFRVGNIQPGKISVQKRCRSGSRNARSERNIQNSILWRCRQWIL